MGASAPDIITYIGVPLAVLGVLPMLFTCIDSLFTLRNIRKLLDRNGVAAITRSSLLSGIVEVEIPRKSITPLDREDPLYFEHSITSSGLKGGSWTLLNWKEMTIGVKSYRFQYHDELCQPQAEVNFEQLVAFLLDLGAVPCQEGFADLRSSGLWTPAGTKLMLSPCTADAVLSVATSEDSDGILALALEWRKEWNRRGINDLPPYWMKLCPPAEIIEEKPKEGTDEDESTTNERDENNPFDETAEASNSGEKEKQSEKVPEVIVTPKRYSANSHLGPEDIRHKRNHSASSHLTVATIKSHKRSLSIISFKPTLSDAIRLRLGPAGLEEASYESLPTKKIRLAHLRTHHNEPNARPLWFAVAATAFSAPRGGLWSFQIPDPILALSNRESVPGGVLVLLDLIAEDAVPAWRTPYDDKMEKHEAWVKQQKKLQSQMAEMHLSPAERQEQWFKRMREENFERQAEQKRKLVEEEQRKEVVLREALVSQRVSIGVVSEACKVFLIKEGIVGSEATTAEVVEKLLWAMVSSGDIAEKMGEMLDAWQRWAEGGGMTKAHFEMVSEDKLFFAYAACILQLIKDTAGAGGNIVSDLQESLRMWKKVRLG
jgi:hypothetical protein